MGIHGEPGCHRDRMASTDATVGEFLGAVVPDLPFESGDEVALMINGLGGTPISEQYLLYGIAHRKLEEKGIKVWRSYVGEYCTSWRRRGPPSRFSRLTTNLGEPVAAPAEIAIRT